MADINHRIGIKAPIAKVYAAVSTVEGVAGWWTRDTTGNASLGGTVKVAFSKLTGEVIGAMEFNMARLVPNQEVHWRITSGPPDWIGTDVTFTLTREDEYVVVMFGHRNWREPGEHMAHCSMKWATFLLSLKQLAESGTGKPAPDDLKIDNWN